MLGRCPSLHLLHALCVQLLRVYTPQDVPTTGCTMDTATERATTRTADGTEGIVWTKMEKTRGRPTAEAVAVEEEGAAKRATGTAPRGAPSLGSATKSVIARVRTRAVRTMEGTADSI